MYINLDIYEQRELYIIDSFAKRFQREIHLQTDSTPVALVNFVERYSLMCQLTGKN